MSSLHPNDLVVFKSHNGHDVLFLGTHAVGAVRGQPGDAGWIFHLETGPDGRAWSRWRSAPDLDAARGCLLRRLSDWWDAAHTPLRPGQGERLAATARLA